MSLFSQMVIFNFLLNFCVSMLLNPLNALNFFRSTKYHILTKFVFVKKAWKFPKKVNITSLTYKGKVTRLLNVLRAVNVTFPTDYLRELSTRGFENLCSSYFDCFYIKLYPKTDCKKRLADTR